MSPQKPDRSDSTGVIEHSVTLQPLENRRAEDPTTVIGDASRHRNVTKREKLI